VNDKERVAISSKWMLARLSGGGNKSGAVMGKLFAANALFVILCKLLITKINTIVVMK
jgi:hypothetical protein